MKSLVVIGSAGTETAGIASGDLFLPATPESFNYDEDGNLTSDGRWNYTWDAENRLVRMVANTSAGPQLRLDFEYDWKSRRIHKKVWDNTAGTGTPTVDLTFIYDGWNLIGELNASHAVVRSYLWGLDLSGTLQGAGGVGGLLAVNDSVAGLHFPAFDGNGNIVSLIHGYAALPSTSYEYGPFGELSKASGPMAKGNPVRFSTKYQDDETDWICYGYG